MHRLIFRVCIPLWCHMWGQSCNMGSLWVRCHHFPASWAICIDESISIWHSRWTYPGWILCPRKLHPFGGHSSCCLLPGILSVVNLVEGKDHPRQSDPLEFEDLGVKTVVLSLRMMKSYFATGRYIILDSGLCVLRGLIQLRKRGVFFLCCHKEEKILACYSLR